jgi:hypothetical protein
MAEIVPETGGVLVGEDDPDALASAIATARTFDRDRVRASALARFDRPRMIDGYEGLMTSIASGAVLPRAA